MQTLRIAVAVLISLNLPMSPSIAAERSAQPRSKVNPKDGLTYVWIPAGTFTMGCSSGDSHCYAWELAPKDQRIDRGFWIGKTEVTQKAYLAIAGKNPSRHQGDKAPVDTVSWNDAKNYCQSLGMRLPTEIEWEYAARGGAPTPYYGRLEDIAWYNVNTNDDTEDVAKKKPNGFGLYDMLGNVWEWVDDLYGDSGDMHMMRGGSFISGERDLRVSNRAWAEPNVAYRYMGFRCVNDESEP